MRLSVSFKDTGKSFAVGFGEEQAGFDADFKDVIMATEFVGGEIYQGDYTVTPKTEKQTLQTREKILTENVEILSIPYFDVSNDKGGSTVYIGSEVE